MLSCALQLADPVDRPLCEEQTFADILTSDSWQGELAGSYSQGRNYCKEVTDIRGTSNVHTLST